MMNMRKTMLAMALTSLFAVGGAASAQYGGAQGGAGGGAQGGQPPQGGAAQGGAPMQQAPEVNLSEEDIDTFVTAFVAVQGVREDFADRLQSAEDETEAQSMQQEAQDEMVNAVENSGMSVEEYNEVAMALQNDPELMQEVQERAEAQL